MPSLQTTTYAHYPGENHHEIRRVFIPAHASHTKRQFCGFCGTPLTLWSEETREEAEWICVNLNVLEKKSVNSLDELGILPSFEDDNEADEPARKIHRQSGSQDVTGEPWFEEMINGSALGRLKRRRGGNISADGRSKVEWEVAEYEDGSDLSEGAVISGKRKIEAIAQDDDVAMKGEQAL